jgi:hypothetical protein
LKNEAVQLASEAGSFREKVEQVQVQLRLWAVHQLEETLEKTKMSLSLSESDSLSLDDIKTELGESQEPQDSLALDGVAAELADLQRQVEVLGRRRRESSLRPGDESATVIDTIEEKIREVRQKIRDRARETLPQRTFEEVEKQLNTMIEGRQAVAFGL